MAFYPASIVSQKTGIPLHELYAMVRKGEFPEPEISAMLMLPKWDMDKVDEWMRNKANE